MQNQDGFRARLKHYRKNLGISQDELAALAGVSRSAIASFETRNCNLSVSSMESVQKALLELINNRALGVGFLPPPPSALSFRGPAPAEV